MRVLHMNFGSLFSGIGGLDLGLERAGMKCLWQSEINPYASRVLKKHWPATPNLGDINDIDWRTVPTVDLVCGGYPCQPFSTAGSRNGTNDPRHLWPRFADCIRILRPRFALLENVTGHLSLGFGNVQADLAALGYDAQWDCIPAAAVGAPHLRDRIFVIATRNDGMDTHGDSKPNVALNDFTQPWPTPMADTSCKRVGSDRTETTITKTRRSRQYNRHRETANVGWEWWQTEPNVGRVADGIPNRVDRLRGLGNAVVPQVAEHIGNIIMDMAS